MLAGATFCALGRLPVLRQELAQRFVHGFRVVEDSSNVWLEQHDVCSLLIALVVLAANTTTNVVFGPHLLAIGLAIRLLHMCAVRQPSCVSHQ